MLRLSILEATAIGPGISAKQALSWTTNVARTAESLGFHRLWVVEHHSVEDIGGTSPAVLIAHLAASTQRIRLGAGGVMLPNHSSLVIAEQFATLQGLHPGRIDLGLGRAPGATGATAKALQSKTLDSEAAFIDKVNEVSGFLSRRFPSEHPYGAIQLSLKVDPVPLYVLGASVSSARTAARLGMRYVYANHLKPESACDALKAYRNEFVPSAELPAPYAILTLAVVSAQSTAEAVHAAKAAAIIRIRRSLSIKHNLGICDELLSADNWSSAESEIADKELSGQWISIGDTYQVEQDINRLAAETLVDEIMFTTIEYEGPGRIRTLNALAPLVSQRTAKVA